MKVDPERFVEVFRLAAAQAGAVASRLQGKVRSERKTAGGVPEAEALTAVDLATQDVVLHLLHDAFPDVAVDAEEDTESASWFPPEDGARPLVVLDPVDGTLNYTRGADDYAVMASLLERGRYVASVIRFPVYDETWWAIRGGGCWVRRGQSAPSRVERPTGPKLALVTPRTPRAWREALGEAGLQVETSRCSAVDASAPAIGRARLSVSRSRADRRRAIGFLLTTEAGGVVRLGAHAWDGEDPAHLPKDAVPSIAASSANLARQAVRLCVD